MTKWKLLLKDTKLVTDQLARPTKTHNKISANKTGKQKNKKQNPQMYVMNTLYIYSKIFTLVSAEKATKSCLLKLLCIFCIHETKMYSPLLVVLKLMI